MGTERRERRGDGSDYAEPPPDLRVEGREGAPHVVGTLRGVDGIKRMAAQTYAVRPTSGLRPWHVVYVVSLARRVVRCNCLADVFDGECKHGKQALAFERVVRGMYPRTYRAELARRARRLARGETPAKRRHRK